MTMSDLGFTPGKLVDFFRFFNPSNANHVQAVQLLQQHVEEADPALMTDLAEWVEKFREPVAVVRQAEKVDNSWEGIARAAANAGSRYPELVAAQWALESGFGKYPAGKNNYWGIKGNVKASCTAKSTKEFIDGKWVTICGYFRNFGSIQEGVNYLVDRWYKDYSNNGRSYKGVNNAPDREAAARSLVSEGYATDPAYSGKLIALMHQYSPKGAVKAEDQIIDLPVAFFSQLDSKTDHGSRMCFSSTCAMAVDFLCPGQLETDQKDDFYLQQVLEFGDTTDAFAQIEALDLFGVKAQFRQNLGLCDIADQLKKGIPVPIGILHKGPSTSPSGFGHWILVVGMGPGYLIVNDPYGELNVADGGYLASVNGDHLKYSTKNLLPRWMVEGDSTGWGLILST